MGWATFWSISSQTYLVTLVLQLRRCCCKFRDRRIRSGWWLSWHLKQILKLAEFILDSASYINRPLKNSGRNFPPDYFIGNPTGSLIKSDATKSHKNVAEILEKVLFKRSGAQFCDRFYRVTRYVCKSSAKTFSCQN
jgi:hypothetical protein